MEYTSKEVYEYVSKKGNDSIVERKKCRKSGQDFAIYQSDLEFYDKVSPTFEVDEGFAKEFLEKNSDIKDYFEYNDGKLKAKIPTPTLCPEEREAQRFAFRNESKLYRSECVATGKPIISIISPDKPYAVYNYDYRWDGDWDAQEYVVGSDIKFADAMSKLVLQVPTWNRFAINNENAEYVNITENSKNSYMCFACEAVEDSGYVRYGSYSSDCFDCRYIENCKHCFSCVQSYNSFNLFYSEGCDGCSNSYYLSHCINCHDCFNCSNLNNKSYCINNKQYSKDDYERLQPTLIPETLQKQEIGCVSKNSEGSFGGSLFNCKNSKFVGIGTNCEKVSYSCMEYRVDNCQDTFLSGSNLSPSSYTYFTICGRYSLHSGFLSFTFNLKNSRYCIDCRDCSYCFGCNGLKNKEYCIYNKEYTKDEYNKIVPGIIAQMIRDSQRGEFFDPQLSYFGYNESMAMDYYPLTKEEALKKGYKRSDYEAPFPKVEKFVPGENLPKFGCKTIQEKKPDFLQKLLNYAIVCEVSKKPFRITKQEIDFYIKHNLPLPTKHPDIRNKERFLRKDPTIMHLVICNECGEEMLSVHKPGQGKKILCEKCFYKDK